MIRIPYWPGKKISFGGPVDPQVIKLELPLVESGLKARRVVSWPGFLLVSGTYPTRKGKK